MLQIFYKWSLKGDHRDGCLWWWKRWLQRVFASWKSLKRQIKPRIKMRNPQKELQSKTFNAVLIELQVVVCGLASVFLLFRPCPPRTSHRFHGSTLSFLLGLRLNLKYIFFCYQHDTWPSESGPQLIAYRHAIISYMVITGECRNEACQQTIT